MGQKVCLCVIEGLEAFHFIDGEHKETIMGITKDGEKLENIILSIKGSSKPKRNKGDAIILVEIDGTPINIGVEAKKNSLNQVRPRKNNIIVLGIEKEEMCYDFRVIPASHIMKMCLGKAGQHAIQPFVCVHIPKPKNNWIQYRCNENQIKEKIIEAYKIDMVNIEYQNLIKEINKEVERQKQVSLELSDKYKDKQ